MSEEQSMRTTTGSAIAIAAGAILLTAATPAAAAPPTIERIPIETSFADGFLTEECGVAVTTTLRGFVLERTFSDPDGNLRALSTVNITGVASSEYGSFRFKDVGADQLKAAPDGTVTVSIIGQLPFDFAGVLVLDLETGEVVHEPRFRGDWQLERACEVLAP
jgi:hypothetical protein